MNILLNIIFIGFNLIGAVYTTVFVFAYSQNKVLLINDTADLRCDDGKVNFTRTAIVRYMDKPIQGEGCLVPLVGKK